ncbi:MAG: enoyl-CoA hydratase/isomerase family protein [Natronospirillum sp.]|uniref:enoyl-CoA hydratase/isomerase family protein n=1 Tax=Natronospirillum sp. TaxID=2812955 RepID=UPI0025D25E77|nr:enoyl-CoA hydratase/isomerase family protein [Natronospirillum sp.]MCH8552700.1 enoyl-CoA hydratase/isomerase family protein [Natronospirillum sp.]
MDQTVHLNCQGATALIEIDNPPVNALSQSVRAGILDALSRAEADPAIEVIALMGRGKVFIAGADIREFGKPPKAPLLPDVIERLEQSEKAVIAILHGVALGGGLEVALGCHYRIALMDTRLGLPEVNLGLLPGAGGTQRLPRLTGLKTAAEWITQGKLVSSETALETGLIDQVTMASSPHEAALEVAEQVRKGAVTRRRTGALANPKADTESLDQLRQELDRNSPELFSPFRILEALEASCSLPLREGLKVERELFLQCMDSPQRAGLIHHFFASRAIGKVPGGEPVAEIEALILSGEHAIFEKLHDDPRVERVSASLPSIEVCLNSDSGASVPTTCHVQLIAEDAPINESRFAFSLIKIPDTHWLELIDHQAQPAVQQALINLLRKAGCKVLPSKGNSIYRSLQASLTGTENSRSSLEQAALQIVREGLCYRPDDLDVIAIEALGYPAHLGGPHFQASS